MDLPGATAVMAVAAQATGSQVRSLVFDLSGTDDPPSCRLLTVFPAVQARIGAWPTHSVHLAGAGPALARRLNNLRIDRHLSVHHSVPAAVTLARAGHDAGHVALQLAATTVSPSRTRQYVDTLLEPGNSQLRHAAEVVSDELTTNACSMCISRSR